jgi:hypothetical protein
MEIKTSRRVCEMCGEEADFPIDTLESMAAAPAIYAEAVRAAPQTSGEGWTPAEIAHHMADTEIGWGWRIRQMLAADNPELQPYDQDDWAKATRYSERGPDAALEAFAAMRALSVEMLRLLTDEEWERTARHVEWGPLTVRMIVEHKSHHDLDHLRQIRGE